MIASSSRARSEPRVVNVSSWRKGDAFEKNLCSRGANLLPAYLSIRFLRGDSLWSRARNRRLTVRSPAGGRHATTSHFLARKDAARRFNSRGCEIAAARFARSSWPGSGDRAASVAFPRFHQGPPSRSRLGKVSRKRRGDRARVSAKRSFANRRGAGEL